ncbi:MAG: ABC transporter ATP-binding protein [Ornithinimicrobium sp.]
MIRTHSLTKRFGSVTAVDGVDLDVREGDVYGFLGANGSGKTTTVRMLLGLVLATSGQIEVLGQPMPRSARTVLPSVGALVEGPAAYPHLSGRANLSLLDAAGSGTSRRGRKVRVREALEQVGLDPGDRRSVRAYSLGMRQRLGLANALLRQPRLLVLDEPTNGLDPQGIHEIRELLLALNSRGTTVVLSSHLLAEVEQTCTRVGVLDRGRLVVQDQMDALRGPTGRTILHTPDVAAATRELTNLVAAVDGDRIVISEGSAADLVERLVCAEVRVSEIGPERRTLEHVVLDATGGRHPVGSR